jgi:hypothetical protein
VELPGISIAKKPIFFTRFPKSIWRGTSEMARDVDRKLRATAAVLGLITRKDLAAAFQRANPSTVFDIERAHKWLQGRSRPRDARLYQDWRIVLGIDESPEWIATSQFEEFVTIIALRHGANPEQLLGHEIESRSSNRGQSLDFHRMLQGRYVCYSNAWSPYFRGQIVRGFMIILERSSAAAQSVVYSEVLPTGYFKVNGSLVLGGRGIHIIPNEPTGDMQFLFSLFPATMPGRVLGGLMCGTTVIGAEPTPSVSRIVMIRLSETAEFPAADTAYLRKGGSLGEDLRSLGVSVTSLASVDERLSCFLSGGDGRGLDQPDTASFRAVVELFDREWLEQLSTSVIQ